MSDELIHSQSIEAYGVDFEDLLEGTRTIHPERQGKKLSVTYNPRKVTTGLVRGADGLDGAIGVVLTLIQDWDLSRGGTKIPLTPEGLESVPLPILKWLLETIFLDNQANPTK